MGFDAFFLGGVVVEWSAHEDTVEHCRYSNVLQFLCVCAFSCLLHFVEDVRMFGGGVVFRVY